MFKSRPIDDAVYRFGARAPRLSLLQQTSPFWDFQKRILQASRVHAGNAAVTDALSATLQPVPLQVHDSSALDVADDEGQAHQTGALLSFVDLLNVCHPGID